MSGHPHLYEGSHLDAIDLPVGPIGGSVIRMNGKAERCWWHIFNNWEEPTASNVLPNSFFAVRTRVGGEVKVRVLQTAAIGSFPAMAEVVFSGEYPFGWYEFADAELPVAVHLEVFNPLIPLNLKDSSIPCAVFRITIINTSGEQVETSVLATQQNAVGYDGYGRMAGPQSRQFNGYGSNVNEIQTHSTSTSLKMTGNAGSMHLSALETGMTGTASWPDLDQLYRDFMEDGSLTGELNACSPASGTTVDGALARTVLLPHDGRKTVAFILGWHFPSGTFGDERVDDWFFSEAGQQYENWWSDAEDVNAYVLERFSYLDTTTRLFHDTIYNSSIPRYAVDRMVSQICVLRSPTAFWTKGGYFGLWESTSSNEQWFGNCKHVYHYAQAHARLFPELGRKLREQDLQTQTENGLFPARTGETRTPQELFGVLSALDGHLGTILSFYREHLLSETGDWLRRIWPCVRSAMDHAIATYDSDHDGLISSAPYHNTLDCDVSGTSPWIGSLYLAALKASATMAEFAGDTAAREFYETILREGKVNQNSALWDAALGYYVEKTEERSGTLVMGDACSIDMLLGQWWANQLNLGQLYPEDRTVEALSRIHANNRTENEGSYESVYRCFLGKGDVGWTMFHFPRDVPENSIRYHNEVMSGFEYALASTFLQYRMFSEGFEVIRSIAERHDGRLRDKNQVSCWENACVHGSGSPFGEDECGDFYGRPMSSWAILLALQGFVFNGPKKTIGFTAPWKPEHHESFFSASSGWGSFKQTRTCKDQTCCMEVKYGSVEARRIMFALPGGSTVNHATVTIDDRVLSIAACNQTEDTIEIELIESATIESGSCMKVTLNLAIKDEAPAMSGS